MPSKSQWLLQVPDIIAELKQLETPVIDRTCIEKVFRVSRRRAIQLMHGFGGYQSGRTFLIDRGALLRSLESLESGEEFSMELRRKERLSTELEKLRKFAAASRVSIPVAPRVYNTRLSSLPEGVHLEPRLLTVSFSTPEELLERLFVLAQALANDFENLKQILLPPNG